MGRVMWVHRRVWVWRRLAYCCAACGLRWRRGGSFCIDDPGRRSGAAQVESARVAGVDRNCPTLVLQGFRLTRGQVWRGNGG